MFMEPESQEGPAGSPPSRDPAPRPSRRVFSTAYKLRIVAEYENAPHGEKGAILRREAAPGLTSGRTRIKAKFTARPEPLALFFPPKWGINDRLPAGPVPAAAPGDAPAE
ncbi:hypothetical protein [Frankia sp. Cppng1_Ct_nod]|uniref:hypothetical protein n=1 Tax=Frankia sp. Cppng1_Ct_nod TaxID=2897162 RepID=UPI0013EFAA52|nr:hypothetical protein [Frankia sp. Cppng1_Ct_nod]